MDKKKLFKERRKRKQSTRRFKERDSINYFMEMQDKGLEQIYLSPITQNFLECRIGEEITADSRWVFVKKEKIEDNMFLHETSSEFLPFRWKIERYPEPEMLIGSYSHVQDRETDFFLCTTLSVKDEMLQVAEDEKRNAYGRVWNLLHPISKTWKDLGSQNEVDDAQLKKTRAPFQILLMTEFPIPYHFTMFTLCFAEDIRNSYTSTFPNRIGYNLIFRRVVDASTQCKLPSEDKGLQTILSMPRNKYVQYSYHFETLKISEENLEKILCFFRNKCDILHETLLVNFNINLFNDDYRDLAINDRGIPFRDPTEVRSFQDVINCKHKKVSCLSWNALVSGMVAVAYNMTPLHYVAKQPPIYNDANETVFGDHLVLVWLHEDNVRPIFYIHAYREVTALSFCPYDANILVGGYNNGQIVVWDITNRIQAVEAREVLTQLELYHRSIMNDQTTWIKPAFGIRHVFPTICSLFGESHNSAVTSISWIPESHCLTRNGKYEVMGPSDEHMQFFTISLGGGSIQVWDLKLQKHHLERNVWKKRPQRLSRVPDALYKTESPLKKLQKSFVPCYRLYIKQTESSKQEPLTMVIPRNQLYKYEVVNPSTLKNIEARTYFISRGLRHPFNMDHKVFLTSALGTLSILQWEGSAYNQGLSINSEFSTKMPLAQIHDGPITSCEISPFLPELLLTTGGNVFAIWKTGALNVPLVWRKSKSKYVAGMWSFRHPLTVFITRGDNHFEVWNVLDRSESPVRLFKFKGSQLIAVYNDPNKLHVRKETFITSDIVGAIKVFYLPSGMIRNRVTCIDETLEFINHIIAIKQYTENLKKRHRSRQKEEKILPIEEIDSRRPSSQPKVVKIVSKTKRPESMAHFSHGANKWQQNLEEHMYHVLLEKKRLNIEEIENNRIPIQILMDEESRKQQKISTKLEGKEENFKKIKDALLVSGKSKRIRRKITVSLPKKVTKILKQEYYESFKIIEEETMYQINNSGFQFTLNWNQLLQYGHTPQIH